MTLGGVVMVVLTVAVVGDGGVGAVILVVDLDGVGAIVVVGVWQ